MSAGGHFPKVLQQLRLAKYWGYINTKGNFVIPPKFDYAQGFSEDRAVVLMNDKHGIIDKTGFVLTDPFDNSGWAFKDGLLEVESDGKWGFIDIHGEVVIPIQFHRANGFAETLAAVEFSDEKNQWGFIDRGGNMVIPPQFQDAQYFGEGLAPVEVEFKYGYIDKNGRIIIKPSFEMAYSFSDGIGVVILKDKYGFIDSKGQFVVPPKYDLAFPFRDGLAAVSNGTWQQDGFDFDPATYRGRWGYMDKAGNEVWKIPNDDARTHVPLPSYP
jgi:hypothetical protein